MNERRPGGGGLIFIWLAAILLIMTATQMLRRETAAPEAEYTMTAFAEAVEKGTVGRVEILPNRETPTGEVRVYESADSRTYQRFYVTDVREAEQLARAHDVKTVVREVPAENCTV